MKTNRSITDACLLCAVLLQAATSGAQSWIWIKGRTNVNAFGIYGTLGVPAAANAPGSRYSAASWKGADGKLYLFGGLGDATSGTGYLADMWRFDPATTNWTWIKGVSGHNSNGVYGVRGVAASTNRPGGRAESLGWTDAAGKLYLFGGYGYGESGGVGRLNDVWQFDPSTTNWTWLKGGKGINSNSIYGALGVAMATNSPGGRSSAVTWSEVTNKFYVFGGYGYATNVSDGELNDLWQFDPATTNWTWLKGTTTINSNGIYGTQGFAGVTNLPGARGTAVAWLGADGSLCVFGGYGYSETGGRRFLNDLWAYDITSTNWTWLRGGLTTSSNAVYGIMGLESPTNSPGACAGMIGGKTSDGKMLVMGGYGSATSGVGELNDLWSFNLATTNWTWLRGSSLVNQSGDYGALGSMSGDSSPGGREAGVAWPGTNGSFYFFGGYGYDDSGLVGRLNDLWSFQPATTNVPLILYPNRSMPEGDFGTNALVFDVQLTFPSSDTVSVAFYTTNVTATAGTDYLSTNGLLTFAPGESVKSVPVPVIGDVVVEGNETFKLILNNVTNAILSTYPGQSGLGTLIDLEIVPTVLATNAFVVEGDTGTVGMVFALKLSSAWPDPVVVPFTTTNITATNGFDYIATNGVVTFAPGETFKTITVTILNDEVFEGNEQFTLVLSNASNAIATNAPGASGLGTIVDDEDVYCTYGSPVVAGYVNLFCPPGYSLNRYGIRAANFTTLSFYTTLTPAGSSVFTIENGKFRANNYLNGWTDPLMALVPGQGWFFKNPAPTNTIVATALGQVSGGCLHSLEVGLSACGSAIPVTGLLQTDLNYAPTNGDVIYLHNNFSNSYTAYTFTSSWSPSEPAFTNVLQAFWIRKTVASVWNERIADSSTNCLSSTPLAHPPATSQTGQLNFFTYNPTNSSLGCVFETNGVTPVDSSYFGQLYAGTNANENNFVPLGAPVNFLDGTGAGCIRGADVLVPFALGGQSVQVQLRVWKASAGSSYEAAATYGNAVGKSAIKQLTAHAAIEAGKPGVPPPDVNTFPSYSLVTVPLIVPALQVAAADSNQVVISWSPPTPGFVLQFSDSLAPPNWTNAPSGATNPITLNATNFMRFYRLKY